MGEAIAASMPATGWEIGQLLLRSGRDATGQRGEATVFACPCCKHVGAIRTYLDSEAEPSGLALVDARSAEVDCACGVEKVLAHLQDELGEQEAEREAPADRVVERLPPPGAAGEDGEWPRLAPLDGPPLPEIDPKWFPEPLRSWIEALSVAYQVPVELPALMALGALSVAVAGKVIVRLSPDWYEELPLYVAVVLPSGERKSPVVREAAAPLVERETRAIFERQEEVAAAQAAHDVLVRRLQEAKAEAAKAKNDADRIDAEERARELAGQVSDSRPPVLPRLLADDATPEALTSLLAEQGGRMAVLSAEGGLFDVLAGRYSDGVANLDTVLKAHSGESVRVDRKNRPPEVIARPTLAIGFAVQPDVIESVRSNRTMLGRGLLNRFLYALPTTALGRRQDDPPAVPESVRAAYAERLSELLDIPPTELTEPTQAVVEGSSVSSVATVGEGREMTLSPEAEHAFRHVIRGIEPRLHPERGDLYCISGWAGKLAGAVARLAGLLHLAEHGEAGLDKPISEETMARAGLIGGCLIEHALEALGHRGPGGADPARLRVVVAWIRRKGAEEFSARDAFRAVGGNHRFPDMGSMDSTLLALVDLGYLRQQPDPLPNPQGGRPPSSVYAVNPDLRGERS